MVAVNLYDTLTFIDDPTGKISLRCDEPAVPADSSNLVMMAAERLKAQARCLRGARIVLNKTIPTQAGLGGGSSDACATLMALDRLWELKTPTERMDSLMAGGRKRRGLLRACTGRRLSRTGRAGGVGASQGSLSLRPFVSSCRRQDGRRLSSGGSTRAAAADQTDARSSGSRQTGRTGPAVVQSAPADCRAASARADFSPRRPGEPGPIARWVLDDWQRLGLLSGCAAISPRRATPLQFSNHSDWDGSGS